MDGKLMQCWPDKKGEQSGKKASTQMGSQLFIYVDPARGHVLCFETRWTVRSDDVEEHLCNLCEFVVFCASPTINLFDPSAFISIRCDHSLNCGISSRLGFGKEKIQG